MSLLSGVLPIQAQTPYLFNLTFRGTVYQTNGLGQVTSTPITQNDLLLAAAHAGGTSDISYMALVYHVLGDSNFGDTIEVWNKNTRVPLTTMFGLYFGDDTNLQTPLGRTALTNNVATQQRRLDYVYMFNSPTELTYPNSHSMGASFTTRRLMGDSNGHGHATFNGQMQWIVNPYNGAGTKVCTGSWTTTTPF